MLFYVSMHIKMQKKKLTGNTEYQLHETFMHCLLTTKVSKASLRGSILVYLQQVITKAQ